MALGIQPGLLGPQPWPCLCLLLLQVECLKHGFAVRTALGDPGTAEHPSEHAGSIKAALTDLLDDSFIEGLKAKTKDDWVLDQEEYGGKWNPKKFTPPNEDGTSHFNVVDQWGNAVSITSTVGGSWVRLRAALVFGVRGTSPTRLVVYHDCSSPSMACFTIKLAHATGMLIEPWCGSLKQPGGKLLLGAL